MDNDERMSGALQENILTLLVFDSKNAKLIRASITPQHFDGAPYRELAGHAIDYLDQFKEPIGEHLPDQIEYILKGDDARKAKAYERILDNLFASKDSVNGDYVLSQLHKFVRQQGLKSALVRAVEAMEAGQIDQVEVEMQKGLNTNLAVFEKGFSLSSSSDVGSVLDNPEEEGFTLGIPELDRSGIYPRRKELYLFLAARGMGKSWFITHCAKQALMQRWSVLVITLEMGEKSYAARMLQSFFAISRKESTVRVTRFKKDGANELVDLITEEVERDTMRDSDIRGKLIDKARQQFSRRKPFLIKAFPTRQLTIPKLRAYLEGLERYEKWSPDLICIDYPDLFEMDSKNKRIELGQLIEDLRGIAVERNCAMVVPSQTNREGETATTVTSDQLSEDISKAATADTIITYSQTKAEYALGLARLFVAKSRNEAGKYSLLITQAYAIGQFCLDSAKLLGEYWEMMTEREDKAKRTRRRRRDDDDSE